MKSTKFALVAAFWFALAFIFSCSDSDNGGSTEQSYDYCITANGCLAGPFTTSACNGQVSNSCPNGSSSSKGSSSSVTSGKSSSSSRVTTTYSLNGVWENSNGSRVTVNGSTGIINAFGTTTALSQSAIDKGYWRLSSTFWRNITSIGNSTWSGQQLGFTYNVSSPNVATGTSWIDVTFFLSTDGQTITLAGTADDGSFSYIYTRQQ